MRPIDADALMERYGEPCHSFADIIEGMPTLDYAPVRHSAWDEYENTIVCKACGEKWSIREDGDFVIIEAKEDLQYCPTCGAKMDGKEDGKDEAR